MTADTDAEIAMVVAKAMEAGAFGAVETTHWADGGAGAVALASKVVECCAAARADAADAFKFLYPLEMPIKVKIETIALQIYGAVGVEYSALATEQIERYTRQGYDDLPICVAKTHLSLSGDPTKKGVPTGFTVTVKSVRASVGAGFIFPLMGKIMTVPGLPTRPGFYDVDIDLDTGRIIGLF